MRSYKNQYVTLPGHRDKQLLHDVLKVIVTGIKCELDGV